MEPLKLPHRTLLTECNFTIETISDEALKGQLQQLEASIAEYEKAPDEKTGKKIEALSAKLQHKIKDLSEASLPEEPPVDTTKQQPLEEIPTSITPPPPPPPPVDEEESASFFERRRKRHS